MKIKKIFEPTHVNGKCAKKVVTIYHGEVIYSIVCDKSQSTNSSTKQQIFKPKQLRIYWDEGVDAKTGWGQSFVVKIGVDFTHDNSEVTDVSKFVLEILGDTFV